MCGRSCLTLSPLEIRHSCAYRLPSEKVYRRLPEFRPEYNCGRKYEPSHNVAPTDITPVLVSAAHFGHSEPANRVLVPMMWGIIPFWHRGPYQKHGLTTNNCRLESMLTSKLYRHSLDKGQRCVILCEGFYEWQTTKNAKPSEREAYYFYMPQKMSKAIKEESRETDQVDDVKKEVVAGVDEKQANGKHMNLLMMAGLFDVWSDENGDNIYSYSVITFESDANFSWLHHRSPAILETDQQVADWLDFKRITVKQAIAHLRPATSLEFHRVSNIVNNSRNKSDQCNKPYAGKKSTDDLKRNALTSWLSQKRKRDPQEEDDDDKTVKKVLK